MDLEEIALHVIYYESLHFYIFKNDCVTSVHLVIVFTDLIKHDFICLSSPHSFQSLRRSCPRLTAPKLQTASTVPARLWETLLPPYSGI